MLIRYACRNCSVVLNFDNVIDVGVFEEDGKFVVSADVLWYSNENPNSCFYIAEFNSRDKAETLIDHIVSANRHQEPIFDCRNYISLQEEAE
ncbi:hypothetical protein [Cloacibacillus porcorum]|uniref:hypothetical protein n=1 Tax=Cloacibacillus porcorum TaxID=1197717 RepID=UPI003D04C34B